MDLTLIKELLCLDLYIQVILIFKITNATINNQLSDKCVFFPLQEFISKMNTDLFQESMNGNTSEVKSLLQNGANPNHFSAKLLYSASHCI